MRVEVALLLAICAAQPSDEEAERAPVGVPSPDLQAIPVLSPPLRFHRLPLTVVSHRNFDLHDWLGWVLRREIGNSRVPPYRILRLTNSRDSHDTHILLEMRAQDRPAFLAVSADLRWPKVKSVLRAHSPQDFPAWITDPAGEEWKERLPRRETLLVHESPLRLPAPSPSQRRPTPIEDEQPVSPWPRLLPPVPRPWVCVIGPHPPNYLHSAPAPQTNCGDSPSNRRSSPSGSNAPGFSISKAAAHVRERIKEFETYLAKQFGQDGPRAESLAKWRRVDEKMLALRATLARLREQEATLVARKDRYAHQAMQETLLQQAQVDALAPLHAKTERFIFDKLICDRKYEEARVLYFRWRANEELKRLIITELAEEPYRSYTDLSEEPYRPYSELLRERDPPRMRKRKVASSDTRQSQRILAENRHTPRSRVLEIYANKR